MAIDYFKNFDNIKFITHRIDYRVLGIDFSNGCAQEEIIAELEKEQWNPYGQETKIDHDIWQGYRYKVHRPISPMLQQISNYFRGDQAKQLVIDALFQHKKGFTVTWGMTPEMMMRNTELHVEFTKDRPGFECGIHCDYRLLVATGLIYLSDSDNINHATVFYDNPKRENPLPIPSGFGQGWFHANDWNTWHDGWNRTTKDRYSMLLGLTLLLKNR